MASAEGQAKLADREQVAIAVHPLLYLVDTDGRALVGDATGIVWGQELFQGLGDHLDRVARHIHRDDVRVADRLQPFVAAGFVGVEVVDEFVDRQPLLAGIPLQVARIVDEWRHLRGDATHIVERTTRCPVLIPVLGPYIQFHTTSLRDCAYPDRFALDKPVTLS